MSVGEHSERERERHRVAALIDDMVEEERHLGYGAGIRADPNSYGAGVHTGFLEALRTLRERIFEDQP